MNDNETRALESVKSRVAALVSGLGQSRLIADQNKFHRELKRLNVAISEGGTLGASMAFKDAARDCINTAKKQASAK